MTQGAVGTVESPTETFPIGLAFLPQSPESGRSNCEAGYGDAFVDALVGWLLSQE